MKYTNTLYGQNAGFFFVFGQGVFFYPDDNVMAHAQKPVLVFRLNVQIHVFRQ